MDQALMEAMGLPTGFGMKKKESTALDKLSRRVKHVTIPEEPVAVPREEIPLKEEIVEESEESEDEFDSDIPPISSRVALLDHKKTVTAISIDPGNSRLLTAGRDYHCKIWDFHSMSTLLKPFHSFEPIEGNPIRDIKWSNNGAMFLCATATAQAKLFDRDGVEAAEFVKGDPYLRDLRHTKGHTAGLTSCQWHPKEELIFLTSSLDSTIRVWSIENKEKQRDCIFVKSKSPGGRTTVTSACYSRDGKLIAGGALDGGLRVWNSGGPYIYPSMMVENAHSKNQPITSVNFNITNHELLTRSMDDTVKLWDLRKFKEPIATQGNVVNYFEECNAIFSPNERCILAGTSSAGKDGGPGSLLILDRKTLARKDAIEIPSSVVRIVWSPALNQIFLGTSDGSVQVLYESGKSHGGILLPLAKTPKKLAVDDYDILIDKVLDAPPTEEELKLDYRKERARRQLITDARNRTRPENPFQEGTSKKDKGESMTEHIMKGLYKLETRNQDPRQEILKYAKIAEENPYFIDPAYKNNKRVIAERVYEDEGERKRDEKKRRK